MAVKRQHRPTIKFSNGVYDRLCQLALKRRRSMAENVLDYVNAGLIAEGLKEIPYPEVGRPRKQLERVMPRRDFDDY